MDREVFGVLEQAVRGNVSTQELKTRAIARGYSSFAELCQSSLPAELPQICLQPSCIGKRISEYQDGTIDREEILAWSQEIGRVALHHRLSYEEGTEDIVNQAIATLTVIANERLFPDQSRINGAMELLQNALDGVVMFRGGTVFRDLFVGRPEAHMGVLPPAEGQESLQWAEVSLFEEPVLVPGESWWIEHDSAPAFMVTTRTLFIEEWGGAPEELLSIEESVEPILVKGRDGHLDQIPSLRKLAPNFDFKTYTPTYFHDADGLAEIVLDVPSVGYSEVIYAVKLFSMQNGIGVSTLNGERVKTLVVTLA